MPEQKRKIVVVLEPVDGVDFDNVTHDEIKSVIEDAIWDCTVLSVTLTDTNETVNFKQEEAE